MHGLGQDCSIFSVNALEILQSCTKPWIYFLQERSLDDDQFNTHPDGSYSHLDMNDADDNTKRYFGKKEFTEKQC